MKKRKLVFVSALFLVLLFGCSPSKQEESAVIASKAEVQPGFVATDFPIPVLVEASSFKMVPLGPDLVKLDFDAYMSSIEHLQKTFSRTTAWPREGITDEEAMLDMRTEQERFESRESFAYAVLTPDGDRERGCVYVRPSKKAGFDAEVSMWVTKSEFDVGFDTELFSWVKEWIATSWSFKNVAYPGREIPWDSWDALPEGDTLQTESSNLTAHNILTAEAFIDAFYSFDSTRLKPLLKHSGASRKSILEYQGWAEGGNYKVLERAPCVADSEERIQCAITVQDDPVVALQTGFNVTDTFALTFRGTEIVSIDTSSNDQPIYYEARKWVEANMPEVMTGPCKGRGQPDYEGVTTPGDCARAMTEGYRLFYAKKTAGDIEPAGES